MFYPKQEYLVDSQTVVGLIPPSLVLVASYTGLVFCGAVQQTTRPNWYLLPFGYSPVKVHNNFESRSVKLKRFAAQNTLWLD